LLIWLPSSASAHANIERSEPSAGEELHAAPQTLRLFFTQRLNQTGSFIQLLDANDAVIPVQVSFDPADPRAMYAAVPSLQPAVYTVRWQSLSLDDDDYAQDRFQFTVLRPDGSRPDAPAASSGNGESSSDSDAVLMIALGVGLVIVVLGGISVAQRVMRGRSA
jgi:methionine-rich copper-binding protein CopC